MALIDDMRRRSNGLIGDMAQRSLGRPLRTEFGGQRGDYYELARQARLRQLEEEELRKAAEKAAEEAGTRDLLTDLALEESGGEKDNLLKALWDNLTGADREGHSPGVTGGLGLNVQGAVDRAEQGPIGDGQRADASADLLRLNNADAPALEQLLAGATRGTANILDGIDPATWLLGNEQGFASRLGQRYGNEFIQNALRPAETGAQRAVDMIGQFGGSLAPFGAAYRGVGAAQNAVQRSLSPELSDLALSAQRGQQTMAETAGQGAVAGGLFNQAGNVSAAFQGDDRSLQERLTASVLEMALGAGGDIAVRGLGRLIQKLRSGQALTPEETQMVQALPEGEQQLLLNEGQLALPEGQGMEFVGQSDMTPTTRAEVNPVDELIAAADDTAVLPETNPLNVLAESPQQRVLDVAEQVKPKATGGDGLGGLVQPANQIVKAKKEPLLGRLEEQFVDDTAPVRWFENTVRSLPKYAEGDLYKAVQLVRGAASAAERRIQSQFVPQVLKPAIDAGVDMNRLSDYLVFKRSHHLVNKSDDLIRRLEDQLKRAETTPDRERIKKELAKAKKNRYTFEDRADGSRSFPKEMNSQNVDEFLRQAEADPELVAAAERFWNYMDNNVDRLIQEGIVAPEQADALKGQFYASLSRNKEDVDDPLISIFDNYSTVKESRRALQRLQGGSEDSFKNPLQQAMIQIFNTEQAIFENRARQKLAALADIDGSGVTLKSASDSSAKGVKVKIDGKDFVVEAPKKVVEVFENAAPAEANYISNAITAVTRFQRVSNTSTPNFLIRSLVRDIPFAYVTSNAKWSLTKDLPLAMLDVFTNGKLLGDKSMLDRYYMSGAGQNTVIALDRDVAAQTMKRAIRGQDDYADRMITMLNPVEAFQTILDGIRRAGSAIEQAPKMAEFRATVRKGGTDAEGAYNARSTMDFARAGSSIRNLNKYVAFINSSIQGKSKVYRAFKNDPLGTFKRASAALSFPTALFAGIRFGMASDEQERAIREAPDWLRRTFWLVPIPGDEENRLMRIPKPFDLAPIFATSLERGLENLADTEGKASVGEMLTEAIASLADTPTEFTALQPILDMQSNYDSFRGMPIDSRQAQGDAYTNAEKADVYTNPIARVLASAVDNVNEDSMFASPNMMDYFLRSYAGALGTEALDFVDYLVSDNPKPESFQPEFNPLKKAFIYRTEGRTAPAVSDFYKMRDKMQGEKRRAEEAGEPFAYGESYTMMNRYREQFSQISSQIREIDNHPDLSASQKQQLRNQLTEERNEIARLLEQAGILDTDNVSARSRLELSLLGQ